MSDLKQSHIYFQTRIRPWMIACFGEDIWGDKTERNHRFIEEALEPVQSTGAASLKRTSLSITSMVVRRSNRRRKWAV
ncbi:hypothetical protein [Candidatus Halocynthiibacter alkanivorans]|uniref:hypothetical protein n=1 Tax=Candidatus Halocynthiibacter alkanivorans TaxID=2267619 RepID=UPI001F31172B|nr:hypothetical protein [Candidatus Halocynthiibacter alkanivorans]